MNKRTARKVALRWAASQLATARIGANFTDPVSADHERNERLVLAEVERIANHLRWEADGRPRPLQVGA